MKESFQGHLSAWPECQTHLSFASWKQTGAWLWWLGLQIQGPWLLQLTGRWTMPVVVAPWEMSWGSTAVLKVGFSHPWLGEVKETVACYSQSLAFVWLVVAGWMLGWQAGTGWYCGLSVESVHLS